MKFIFHLDQYKIEKSLSGPPKITKTPLRLNRCNSSAWKNLGSDFDGQFNAFGFDQMLCLEEGQQISLSGYTGSDVY